MTTYYSRVFDPLTLEQAKRVVLTIDPSHPNKFKDETQFMMDFIVHHKLITVHNKVLDFGCGMGRLSKELIEQIGCEVIGVDQSIHMQMHAINYVDNIKFDTCTEYNKSDIDVVIACLVLQHVEFPHLEIERIFNSLKNNGIVILVNESVRYVPSGVDNNGFVKWIDDGINIQSIMMEKFRCVGTYDYPNTSTQPLSVWVKLLNTIPG